MDQSDSPLDSRLLPPDASTPPPLYWSVRRELWENRSVYLGPLIVAAFVLFASLIGTLHLPSRMREIRTLDEAKQHAAIVSHYSMAPAPIILVTFLIGMFYCLDALYGERRDRSILFWKSLPVGEIWITLWLLIKGARVDQLEPALEESAEQSQRTASRVAGFAHLISEK